MPRCILSLARRPQCPYGKMKVLFLCDGLAPFVIGGMQQHSTMLVRHLAPLVEHVTLMHCGIPNEQPVSSNTVLRALNDPRNVTVIGVEFEDNEGLPGHYLRACKRLSSKFFRLAGRLENFDVIYAQGLTGNAFLGKHEKVVVNLHGLEMFQPSFSWRERIEKAWLRPAFRKQIKSCWRNVSLGGKLSSLLKDQGAKEETIAVIPNGIDDEIIVSMVEGKFPAQKVRRAETRFVMIGRYEFRKGFQVLEEALLLIEKPVEIHLIGDWPRLDAGHHKVIHHGVLRDRSAVMAILDECEVLLVPSLSEGMPTVILEAMSRGLHIIATDVGAVRDCLPVELLALPGDVKGFAELMSEYIAGRNFQSYEIENFSFKSVAEKTYATINESQSIIQ